MFMSVFSYVSCLTEIGDTRTMRFGIINGMWTFATAISLFVSGIMLDNTSFLFVFCFALGVAVLSILYVLIFIRDTQEERHERKHSGKCAALMDAFDSLKEGVKHVIKKSPDNGRVYIILILLFSIVNVFCLACELVLSFIDFTFQSFKGWTTLDVWVHIWA